MGKTVKMGLLGMGRIGKLHAMNIQNSLPNAEIIVAVDPFLNEEMEAWAKGIGITNFSKDPKDVFENKEVEAVLICSSTDTHADFIIQSARAGKQIFCEKPIHTD